MAIQVGCTVIQIKSLINVNKIRRISGDKIFPSVYSLAANDVYQVDIQFMSTKTSLYLGVVVSRVRTIQYLMISMCTDSVNMLFSLHS